ncbi:hypothetical protein HD554DRAFT_2082510 [Boletus coccyginus]|nr:hypothetical protein HD554DRAFT_2082510 [Boletus coccyginus]
MDRGCTGRCPIQGRSAYSHVRGKLPFRFHRSPSKVGDPCHGNVRSGISFVPRLLERPVGHFERKEVPSAVNLRCPQRQCRSWHRHGTATMAFPDALLLPDSQSKSFRCSGNAAGFSSTEFRQVQRFIVSPLSNEATRDHPVCRLPFRVLVLGSTPGALIHFGMLHGGQALGFDPRQRFPDQLTACQLLTMVSTKDGHPVCEKSSHHHHPCRRACTRTSIWALWPPASASASVFAYF